MIPASMDWPPHRNSSLAGTTQSWFGSDSNKSFTENCNNTEKLKILKDNGWLDTQLNYKFNQQGFRSIEFDPSITAGMAIGCSCTQGIGLRIEDTWPSIVSKNVDIPIWNLGVGGSSMDTAFRLIDYWLPILKPKFVLHACTFDTRMEMCYYNGEFVNFTPEESANWSYKQWVDHPANRKLNFRKNLLAITNICNNYNIPYVWLSIQDNFIFDQKARDLLHPGATANIDFADKMFKKLKEIQ